MAHPAKRSRYDVLAAATAQFYNTTGTVPASLQLATDISYLVTNQPSCTIVVAEIPSGCTERDLIGLFNRYGQVKNAKLVCNGRAALVEFCEISPPTRLVHMAKINPFCVGHNRVRLEFSSEVITPAFERKVPIQQSSPDTGGPTRILHLDVANADYPITVDVIKAICSPHGNIQRIFIGKKNVDKSLEALVEYETVDEAKAAKEQLDGADIYSGCCSLTVAYSRLQRIHVTKNDTESWDYTGPNANTEGPLNNLSGQRTLLGPAVPQTGMTPLPNPSPGLNHSILPPPVPTVNYPAAPPVYPGPPPYPPNPQAMGFYGMPPVNSPMYHVPTNIHYGAAYPGFMPQLSAGTAMQSVRNNSSKTFTPPSQITILPTPAAVHQVNSKGIGIGHSTSNLSTANNTARQADISVFETMEGVVLMASNLPAHLNCDHIFNLLCLYGNVARIKFLKTRPGCAMIQVGNAETADMIHRHFNGISFFGHTVQFHHSKQPELAEHENLGTLADGSPVMKNYMMDPNNRFRNAMVAAKSRILEPSRTLHFFNAPLNFTPDEVCRVFTDAGVNPPPRIVIFTYKSGQKTSLGLVEWDTLSEALEALILANHRPIHLSGYAHPFHLKLAFSPKPITDDRAGLSLIRYPAPPLSSRPDVSNSSAVRTNDTASEQQDKVSKSEGACEYELIAESEFCEENETAKLNSTLNNELGAEECEVKGKLEEKSEADEVVANCKLENGDEVANAESVDSS